ncbi:MAG: YdcF family protein [Pseudomonadota bacterium]|nr:YdcF family protein [Pseudomonadota bacterium]
MLFALSKIGWLFAAPSRVLLLAALAGLLLRRRALTLAALALMAAAAILPLGGFALARLEATFPPLAAPARIDGILVIGGALNAPRYDKWPGSGFDPAIGRLFEAARLAKAYPQARLLDIGGPNPHAADRRAEADAAADVLVRLGVARERIEIERESRNTYENAVNAAAIAHPKPGETWVLITSAFHMPRAFGCFRVAGFAPLADPVDYHWIGDVGPGFDVAGGLETLDLATHEFFGLASYRAMGRTDALWPGP